MEIKFKEEKDTSVLFRGSSRIIFGAVAKKYAINISVFNANVNQRDFIIITDCLHKMHISCYIYAIIYPNNIS